MNSMRGDVGLALPTYSSDHKVKINEPKVQGIEMSTAMQQVKNCLV
jgi:hypothetical protein